MRKKREIVRWRRGYGASRETGNLARHRKVKRGTSPRRRGLRVAAVAVALVTLGLGVFASSSSVRKGRTAYARRCVRPRPPRSRRSAEPRWTASRAISAAASPGSRGCGGGSRRHRGRSGGPISLSAAHARSCQRRGCEVLLLDAATASQDNVAGKSGRPSPVGSTILLAPTTGRNRYCLPSAIFSCNGATGDGRAGTGGVNAEFALGRAKSLAVMCRNNMVRLIRPGHKKLVERSQLQGALIKRVGGRLFPGRQYLLRESRRGRGAFGFGI